MFHDSGSRPGMDHTMAMYFVDDQHGYPRMMYDVVADWPDKKLLVADIYRCG